MVSIRHFLTQCSVNKTDEDEVGLDLPAAQQDAAGTLLCRDGCAAVTESAESACSYCSIFSDAHFF